MSARAFPVFLAVTLATAGCAVTEGDIARTEGGLYETAAWHPLFTEAAWERAFEDAEAFCRETNRASSVRDTDKTRTLFGVTVRRRFKCVEP